MKKRRFLCVCLAVIMLVGLLPGAASASMTQASSERFVITDHMPWFRYSLSNQPISYEWCDGFDCGGWCDGLEWCDICSHPGYGRDGGNITVRVGTSIRLEAGRGTEVWLNVFALNADGSWAPSTPPLVFERVPNGSSREFTFHTVGNFFVAGQFSGAGWRITVVADTPPPPPATPFTDISGHWAADAIAFVYERGLMTGTTATTFAPDATLNRAMVATILYRMAGSPAVTFRPVFTDVSAGQWYSNAIIWALDAGIVQGTTATTFAPGANITREQFATMMHRYARHTGENLTVPPTFNLNQFTDRGAVSAWAADAMLWANFHGLITGVTPTTLVPQGTANRAQCATILMRYMQAFVD